MQQQGKSSIRLVHLTDPHLSRLDGVSFGSLRGKRWSGFVSWHKNRKKKYLGGVLDCLTQAVQDENADQVLVTGDLVQIGLESEISQATEWLRRLGPAHQLMLVPGNHDIYARESVTAVQDEWSDYLFHGRSSTGTGLTDRFPVVRELGELTLVGLSSACVTPTFMATGCLGGEQLDRLGHILRQASSEKRLVCLLVHHAPLEGMAIWRKALTDAAALESVLEACPPAMVFHGHLHHNREVQWGDSRIYCTAAASSAADASYRVLDIEYTDSGTNMRMRLKSITLDESGNLIFITVDEQSWQVPFLNH